MSDTVQYRVGSYLIDSSQIYVISKIEAGRLYYKPAFGDNLHHSVTGSVPLTNIEISGYRPLLSKKEIENFYKALSQATSGTVPIDPKFFKEVIILNNPIKTAVLLRQLWKSKNSPHTTFSGSNNDTLENILNHLCEEFSLSTKMSPGKIRTKIISILSK